MENTSVLYSVKVNMINGDRYLFGFKTLTEANNLAVRLEEDDSVADIKVLTR